MFFFFLQLAKRWPSVGLKFTKFPLQQVVSKIWGYSRDRTFRGRFCYRDALAMTETKTHRDSLRFLVVVKLARLQTNIVVGNVSILFFRWLSRIPSIKPATISYQNSYNPGIYHCVNFVFTPHEQNLRNMRNRLQLGEIWLHIIWEYAL